MRLSLVVSGSALLALASGCSALVDGTLAGRGSAVDAGMDSGPPVDANLPDADLPDSGPASPCTGMPLGLHCTVDGIDEPFVCVDDICSLSRCGDGALDARTGSMHEVEQCDDGNSIPGDGCEDDCTFSCATPADCDDGELCNGTEGCSPTTHACVAGTMESDTTPCTVSGMTALCHGGICRAGVCPNGIPEPGEECDDNNANDGDGCDRDCTFTCEVDGDCQDGNACNGNETCDTLTHQCMAATETLMCDDGDACTADSCDMAMGCVNMPLRVDADHDGHYAMGGACPGDDCNDGNPGINPEIVEPCGSTMDLNCDGMMGVTPTWYADCDRDTYAPSGAQTVMSCQNPPTTPPTTCSTGTWTQRAPTSQTTRDCLDTPTTGNPIHPGQTGWFTTSPSALMPPFDYDCSGSATRQYTLYGDPTPVHMLGYTACSGSGSHCSGSYYWVSSTAPTCGSTRTLFLCASSRLLSCGYENSSAVVACH